MGDHVLIRCHCGQLTETVQLQQSIPVENVLCHCNSCRRSTGALTFTGLKLMSPPIDAFTTKLTKYASSEKLWRYFCETCGSHVCYYVVKGDRWNVCSGAVDRVIGNSQGQLERFVKHEYVADTKDGGLLPIFPTAEVHLGDETAEPSQNWRSHLAPHKTDIVPVQFVGSIEAVCHCGSVKFSFERPNTSDADSKWGAGICACRSCRLSCGQSIVPWAFNIPFAKIQWSDGCPFDGSLHDSLRRFQSSDHASRDFCKTCGASVFYYSSKQPGEVDVNFGILHAGEGSLAKSWFKWNNDSIHCPEDAVDDDLIKTLQTNLRSLVN